VFLADGGPLRGAFFAEGAKAFAEIVTREDVVPHLLGEGAGLVRREGSGSMDELEAGLDGGRAGGREPEGDIAGTVGRIVGDLVDECAVAGLGGGEEAAGKGEFEGAAGSEGGFHGAVNEERPEAEANLGETEGGVGGGDDDVSVGDESGTAAEGGAVNGGDERAREAGADGEKLLVKAADFVSVGGVLDLGEVHAGAEGGAVGSEEDGTDRGVLVSVVEGVDEGAAQVGVEGVALVRAVEGEIEETPVARL